MRTQLRSTRVSAEPGKRNLRVKVGSVKRISVLNLTRVTTGYPVQILHVSVLGSVKRTYLGLTSLFMRAVLLDLPVPL